MVFKKKFRRLSDAAFRGFAFLQRGEASLAVWSATKTSNGIQANPLFSQLLDLISSNSVAGSYSRMAESEIKTAVEINRPIPNYPLMVIGGFVFLCLLASIALAFQAAAWSIMVMSVFALVGAVAYLYFRSMSRPVSLEHRLEWQPALTEVQKQGLALEVEGIAASLQLDPWQTTELFSAYVVAEDLALRQIQQKHSAPMMRHLQVGGTPFDALIISADELLCVEVAFVVTPDVRQEKIDSMMKKMGTVRRFLNAQKLDAALKLLVVVVTQLTPDEVEELRSRLKSDRFPDSPVDIDIEFFDFENLQRQYVTEN
jgi:hypothetical protein